MFASSPAERRLDLMRRLTLAALAAVLVGVGVRLAMIDGWLRRVSIAGSSMAPALQGEHYEATCADCGFVREFSADSIPGRGEYVCPNCCSRREPRAVTPRPADRVLIDRWPLLWRNPKRWEVVAAAHGDDMIVKRVVALPGERLELRGGDVWIDRRPTERSETLQQFQSLTVYDDAHRSESPARRRWKAGAGWTETADGFVFAPSQPAPSPSAGRELAEVVYHHARVDYRPGGKTEPSPILDDDPYNPNENRRLQEVRDIGVAFRMAKDADADVSFALHDGAAWCYARWSAAERRWRLLREELPLSQRTVEEADEREEHYEFSRCDGRLRLTVNGVTLLESLLPPTEDDCDYSSEPLRIGAAGGAVTVRELVVRRNIFYLHPLGRGGDWEAPRVLGGEEFALLGDNSSASVDSRQFPEYGVRRERLIGIVIPWNRRLAP